MQSLLGVGGFLLFMGYGVFQMFAGYIGIDYHFGALWAGVAIVAGLMFRFTLPITIGAFFCAINIWHWHWALAALFVAPGLALLIPGVIFSIIEGVKR
tara:strand:+ start:397 stop:690 length:294 start_codon:yes stop_codon:yes gene_type:complete